MLFREIVHVYQTNKYCQLPGCRSGPQRAWSPPGGGIIFARVCLRVRRNKARSLLACLVSDHHAGGVKRTALVC